jgi:hypothetical protein
VMLYRAARLKAKAGQEILNGQCHGVPTQRSLQTGGTMRIRTGELCSVLQDSGDGRS